MRCVLIATIEAVEGMSLWLRLLVICHCCGQVFGDGFEER